MRSRTSIALLTALALGCSAEEPKTAPVVCEASPEAGVTYPGDITWQNDDGSSGGWSWRRIPSETEEEGGQIIYEDGKDPWQGWMMWDGTADVSTTLSSKCAVRLDPEYVGVVRINCPCDEFWRAFTAGHYAGREVENVYGILKWYERAGCPVTIEQVGDYRGREVLDAD